MTLNLSVMICFREWNIDEMISCINERPRSALFKNGLLKICILVLCRLMILISEYQKGIGVSDACRECELTDKLKRSASVTRALEFVWWLVINSRFFWIRNFQNGDVFEIASLISLSAAMWPRTLSFPGGGVVRARRRWRKSPNRKIRSGCAALLTVI